MTDNSDRTDTKAGLGNKYIMACVIAKRARYLSEKKGRELEENIGNPIFLAMKEIEQGKIKFTTRAIIASEKAVGGVISDDAGMEEKT